MTKQELEKMIRTIVKEEIATKKKKIAVQLTDGGKMVMNIFYQRDKTLKFNRRDYRTDANLLAKIYGVEAVQDRMNQLDKMTECKLTIVNPTQLREKYNYESFKKVDKVKSVITI